jgi:prohibitin 1
MRCTTAILAIVMLPFGGCGTMIAPGHMGLKYIVLDDPALQENPRGEGFYFQWPWNDIVDYDVTWQSRDEDIEVLTADDLHVPTTVTVTYRPIAERLHELHISVGPSYYEDVIRPRFMTLVRTEFASFAHNDLARKSPEIEDDVLQKLAAGLAGHPVEINRISISHIRFDQAVTRSISEKLVKEQEAERKAFELEIAVQDAEIARAEAKGLSDAVRIGAEGDAQAIIIKGKAQAEAQQAIAKTLTKEYLQYKAFDGSATRYYFLPTGKDGLPVFINTPGK